MQTAHFTSLHLHHFTAFTLTYFKAARATGEDAEPISIFTGKQIQQLNNK